MVSSHGGTSSSETDSKGTGGTYTSGTTYTGGTTYPSATYSNATSVGFATSVSAAIYAEQSHDPGAMDHGVRDPGGMNPGGTVVPINTVANQDGPPTNVPTLLKCNTHHVPASPLNKQSLDLGVTVAHQNGSPNDLHSPLECNTYQHNTYQHNTHHFQLCSCTCNN